MKVELNTSNTLASNGQVTQQISLNLDFLTLLLGVLGKGENLDTTEQNLAQKLAKILNKLEKTDNLENFKQLLEKIKEQSEETDSDNLDIFNFLTNQLSINLKQDGTIISTPKNKINELQITNSQINDLQNKNSQANKIQPQFPSNKNYFWESASLTTENEKDNLNNHKQELNTTTILDTESSKNKRSIKNEGEFLLNLKTNTIKSETQKNSNKELTIAKEKEQSILNIVDKKDTDNLKEGFNKDKEEGQIKDIKTGFLGENFNKRQKKIPENKTSNFIKENHIIKTTEKQHKTPNKHQNNSQEISLPKIIKTDNNKKNFSIDSKAKEELKTNKDDKIDNIQKKEHNIFMSEIKNNIKNQNINQTESLTNILKTDNIKPQDFPSFVKDLIFHINQDGKHHIKIKLDPPNLGEVRISMSIDKGEVRLIFTVENSHAAQAIQQQINNLSRAIYDCGLQLSSCHINLGQNSEEYKRNEQHARDNKKITKIETTSKENTRINSHQGLINITI